MTSHDFSLVGNKLYTLLIVLVHHLYPYSRRTRAIEILRRSSILQIMYDSIAVELTCYFLTIIAVVKLHLFVKQYSDSVSVFPIHSKTQCLPSIYGYGIDIGAFRE